MRNTERGGKPDAAPDLDMIFSWLGRFPPREHVENRRAKFKD